MGKKQKLTHLVDVVKALMGDDIDSKKLRKKKALKRFINKMVERRTALKKRGDNAKSGSDKQKTCLKHVKILEKQIKKARKILDDL